jgi:hypothetical protein
MRKTITAALAAALLAGVAACSSGGPSEPSSVTASLKAQASTSTDAAPPGLPRPQHVVVVMEENHSYGQILGSAAAPYMSSLAKQGADFTNSFAVAHPSEPNYLALFSGSTQGLTDDSCPHTFSGVNLGSQLLGAKLSFAGYSESMPSPGYQGCNAGEYARRHNPWLDFPSLPASTNLTFQQWPANGDYASLPTLSFVVPNVQDDMHDGTVQQGDAWLRTNLSGYATWAATHDSLLIVTWDEDDDNAANHIATFVVGAGVRPGSYSETVDHYRMLRTLEALYGLPGIGEAALRAPITDIWQP